MDALGIRQAHVVGASMGGMIAQIVAIEHPKRVKSLTSIMSTTGDRDCRAPTAMCGAHCFVHARAKSNGGRTQLGDVPSNRRGLLSAD